ncbi:MAG: LegC family aminotransferase [Flavobacteriaceae bacterium]|nr:LegC family aminotransferase [Flavobacteriaceae bacterium]
MYNDIVNFIQDIYKTKAFIPLHVPVFKGNEKAYVIDAIDSTFVSSIGEYVNRFEDEFAKKVRSKYAIATVNGTSALHIALLLLGVKEDTEVITQPLTFIATCNAINYLGAKPHFVDVDKDSMGLSPTILKAHLTKYAQVKNGKCYNKITKRRISACVPMHTFGHASRIDEIVAICDAFRIPVLEDAAESLGSLYKNQNLGTFGKLGVFSFNGNKIITAGGGGAIVTDDAELAKRAKHLTTTAKLPHRYEYAHDEIGYNYRMPNLNAALLVGQLEKLDSFVKNKRELAKKYETFFQGSTIAFKTEIKHSHSNYWLNVLLLEDKIQRDIFLNFMNDNGIMSRPVWQLMNTMRMFENSEKSPLVNSKWLADRIVNIPSSITP